MFVMPYSYFTSFQYLYIIISSPYFMIEHSIPIFSTSRLTLKTETSLKLPCVFKVKYIFLLGDCFLHHNYFKQNVASIFIPTVCKDFLFLLDC